MDKGFIEIELTSLSMAKWNYKTNNKELQQKLVNNIKRNGQIENIIIRELDNNKFEIINGNHRFLALKELKYKKVTAYNLGKISLNHAKRIAIETNETRFVSDNNKLSDLLIEISQEFNFDDLVQTMPYTLSDLYDFTNIDNQIELPASDNTNQIDKLTINITSEVRKLWNTYKAKLAKEFNEQVTDNKALELALADALATIGS